MEFTVKYCEYEGDGHSFFSYNTKEMIEAEEINFPNLGLNESEVLESEIILKSELSGHIWE